MEKRAGVVLILPHQRIVTSTEENAGSAANVFDKCGGDVPLGERLIAWMCL